MTTRDEAIQRINDERTAWQALLAEVGEDRMEEPGPMGDWTFKDLAAHLLFWNERPLVQLDAGPGATVPAPWPASMGAEDEIEDWDEVNAWVREQYRARPLADILAETDRQFQRFAAVIQAMPEDDLMKPGRFGGTTPVVDWDLFGHLHEEHEPSLREWLRTR